MSEYPEWPQQLQEALGGLSDALAKVGHILTAQGAMGWMYQGEFDKAREVLKGMPLEQVEILGMASRALAELADAEAVMRT